jgi:hypothetical protein
MSDDIVLALVTSSVFNYYSFFLGRVHLCNAETENVFKRVLLP